MADFLRLRQINKTRKPHVCTACGGAIPVGSKAFEWVSVDGTVYSTYLDEACGEDVQNHCFSCKQCDDGDGFDIYFMSNAAHYGTACTPCERLRKAQVE